MPDSTPVARQLLLYQKYSDQARRSTGELRESYISMARDALRHGAKLDPAAVAHASALAMTTVV